MIMIDVEEDSTKARICQTPKMTQQPWNSPIPDTTLVGFRTPSRTIYHAVSCRATTRHAGPTALSLES
jgi:hypothetical protein